MYHFVVAVLQPYPLLFVLTGLGLANLWRKRKESRRRLLLACLPFAGLWVMSLPFVGYLALGSLEWQYASVEALPAEAQAIVVLSGDVLRPDAVRKRAELGESTVSRCLRAAELYREGRPCPVVATGGKVDPAAQGPSTAELMRALLVSLGVRSEDLIEEDRARSTYENARETARLLEPRGIRTLVVVTDAAHLPRAIRCFRKQGITALPGGCRQRATVFQFSPLSLLPSAGSARSFLEACHEWLGLAWYRLHGWA